MDVREVGADWLWLVDDAVDPRPGALDRLLAALDDLGPLPPPVLLTSKIVAPDGAPDPGSLPVPHVKDADLAAAAVERHVLPVRIARRGSLLVRRRVIDQHGLGGDDLRWSARLLKHEPGYLVPASEAVRAEPRRSRELGRWAALLASDALQTKEKPWFAFRLVEQALGRA